MKPLTNIYKRIHNYFILFLLINISESFISFNFLYSFTLSNGNIFVIHQKGVTICDNHLKTILLNVITFSEDEEIITEASLTKITTTFQYGYIISIINDKIYIFDEFGQSIYNGTDKILSSGETAEYYTLVPIKIEDGYYHYVIGYIHNKLLYFLYYKYNFSSKANNLSTSRKAKRHEDYDSYGEFRGYFYIESKALSCQYMKNKNNKKPLVCFFMTYDDYYSKYFITVDYFLLAENGITVHSSFVPDYHGHSYNFKCIKTALSQDLSKAIVVMYPSTGIPYYFLFDVYFELSYQLKNFRQELYCRNQFHGLKMNYYKDKEEFIFSCIDDNGKISVEFFNKNYINYNFTFKYHECQNIYGYSILYINNDQKYYIISDVKCNGINYPFNLLYGQIEEEEEEEEEEEKEEKEEKEKEEK